MVVTSVRDGRAAMPSQGGVDREVSTKVIVVVATEVETGRPNGQRRRGDSGQGGGG